MRFIFFLHSNYAPGGFIVYAVLVALWTHGFSLGVNPISSMTHCGGFPPPPTVGKAEVWIVTLWVCQAREEKFSGSHRVHRRLLRNVVRSEHQDVPVPVPGRQWCPDGRGLRRTGNSLPLFCVCIIIMSGLRVFMCISYMFILLFSQHSWVYFSWSAWHFWFIALWPIGSR